MPIRIVIRPHPFAGCGSHLVDEIRPVKEKTDRMRELLAITIRIKKAGKALLYEFTARAQIGSDHWPSPGIGLENRLAQSFRSSGNAWK